MPTQFSFDHISLSVSGAPPPSRPREDTPFRILVLADFSGRESRAGCEPLAGRRAAKVDIDNIESVLARMKPALMLPDVGSISFASLDDFHPDRIYERVPLFEKLRTTPPASAGESDAETLARLLGETPRELPPPASVAAGGIQDLIRHIVAPHVVASADPNAAAMTAAVDAAMGARMRALLHEPAFQALEAAWRGVDFLVRNLDTDETLTLHLLDVSKAELAADLRGVDDLARTAIFATLVGETVQSPGGVPWALIVGDYTFGSDDEDADWNFTPRPARTGQSAHRMDLGDAGLQPQAVPPARRAPASGLKPRKTARSILHPPIIARPTSPESNPPCRTTARPQNIAPSLTRRARAA